VTVNGEGSEWSNLHEMLLNNTPECITACHSLHAQLNRSTSRPQGSLRLTAQLLTSSCSC